jgi:peptidoglycan/xylan/chitin deacetylase (PgdA/CDA1 family)
VSILCYHTIDEGWSSGLAMTPAEFRAHARWLSRNRRIVDLGTAIRLMDRRGRLPHGVTALTFDDGLEGVHEHALPVLQALRLPATVFVVGRTATGDRAVDWVDDPPADRPLRTLDLDQLRDLIDAGVEIGSHSYAHHVLPDLDGPACEEDLRISRQLLEDLVGAPIPYLAYPRGRHDPVTREAARRAGYEHAFSLPEAAEPLGRFSLPRVGVYRHNGVRTLRAKSTSPYLRARLHPATGPVRRTARFLRRRRSDAPVTAEDHLVDDRPAEEHDGVDDPLVAAERYPAEVP